MQIGPLPILVAIDPGEILEVPDDLPDTADAVLGLTDQQWNILEDVLKLYFAAQLHQPCLERRCVDGRLCVLVGLEHVMQAAEVAVQRPQVGGHKTDRVVHLMGDTCGQLAERGEFF
ncbi:hypothetical protein D3C81_710000 [compost metagenome]